MGQCCLNLCSPGSFLYPSIMSPHLTFNSLEWLPMMLGQQACPSGFYVSNLILHQGFLAPLRWHPVTLLFSPVRAAAHAALSGAHMPGPLVLVLQMPAHLLREAPLTTRTLHSQLLSHCELAVPRPGRTAILRPLGSICQTVNPRTETPSVLLCPQSPPQCHSVQGE